MTNLTNGNLLSKQKGEKKPSKPSIIPNFPGFDSSHCTHWGLAIREALTKLVNDYNDWKVSEELKNLLIWSISGEFETPRFNSGNFNNIGLGEVNKFYNQIKFLIGFVECIENNEDSFFDTDSKPDNETRQSLKYFLSYICKNYQYGVEEQRYRLIRLVTDLCQIYDTYFSRAYEIEKAMKKGGRK